MSNKIGTAEVRLSQTLTEAKLNARDWSVDAVQNYHDIADALGTLTTRELLGARHTFQDSPAPAVRKRAAELLVGKWRWSKRREIAERVARELLRSFAEECSKCDLFVDDKGQFDDRSLLRDAFAYMPDGAAKTSLQHY